MKEPKYKIGEMVWILISFEGMSPKCIERGVEYTRLTHGEKEVGYYEFYVNGKWCYDHQLFPSKEALIASL